MFIVSIPNKELSTLEKADVVRVKINGVWREMRLALNPVPSLYWTDDEGGRQRRPIARVTEGTTLATFHCDDQPVAN
jgi:hypothetical protein